MRSESGEVIPNALPDVIPMSRDRSVSLPDVPAFRRQEHEQVVGRELRRISDEFNSSFTPIRRTRDQTKEFADIFLSTFLSTLLYNFEQLMRTHRVYKDNDPTYTTFDAGGQWYQSHTPPDDGLLSFEKLDRASQDLWPEQIPGVSEFAAEKLPSLRANSPPKWMADLENDDINLLQEFGSLTTSQLIEKVRGLQNLAYQLGLEESREMTRGKFLQILQKAKK